MVKVQKNMQKFKRFSVTQKHMFSQQKILHNFVHIYATV